MNTHRGSFDNRAVVTPAGVDTSRCVLDTLCSGVVVHDAAGSVIYANRSAAQLLGATPDRLALDHWQLSDQSGRRVPHSELPPARALRTGEPVFGDVLGRRAGDDTTWISISSMPVPRRQVADDGDWVTTTIVDVTAQSERVRGLEMLGGQIRALFEDSLTACMVIGADGHFVAWNDHAAELLGRAGADLARIEHRDVLPFDLTEVRRRLSTDREGARFVEGLTEIIRPSGHRRSVRARVHSIAWPEHPRSVFVEVFERSPDDARGTGGPASATATLHLDRAGFVVASNQPCRATFGDETDDLVGAHVDALVAFGAVPSAEILARVTDRGEPVDVADATLLTDRGVHATSARVRATHDLLRPIAIELFSTDDRSERTTP